MTVRPDTLLFLLLATIMTAGTAQAIAIDQDPSDYGNLCSGCLLGTSIPGVNHVYDLSKISPNGSPGLAFGLSLVPNETLILNYSGTLDQYGLFVCGQFNFPAMNGLPCVSSDLRSTVTLATGSGSSLLLSSSTFSGELGVYFRPNGAAQPTITSAVVAVSSTPEPASFLLAFGLAAVVSASRRYLTRLS